MTRRRMHRRVGGGGSFSFLDRGLLFRVVLFLLTTTDTAVVTGWTIVPTSSSSSNHHPPHGFAVQSVGGWDPNRPSKVNQDAYFHHHSYYYHDNNNNITASEDCTEKKQVPPPKYGWSFWGVLDGHGPKAERLTAYLASIFPSLLEQQYCSNHHYSFPLPPTDRDYYHSLMKQDSKTNTNDNDKNNNIQYPKWFDTWEPPEASHPLVRAFHQAHRQAMEEPTVRAGRCGTTCVVVAVVTNDNTSFQPRAEVAYVGDSRAILIRPPSSQPSNRHPNLIPGHSVVVRRLTQETTVEIPAERERIEQGEGTIVGKNVFYGPQGIAMTRALGDW